MYFLVGTTPPFSQLTVGWLVGQWVGQSAGWSVSWSHLNFFCQRTKKPMDRQSLLQSCVFATKNVSPVKYKKPETTKMVDIEN